MSEGDLRTGKVIIADPAALIALAAAHDLADLSITIEIPDVVYFEATRNENGEWIVPWCNRNSSRFVPTHTGIEYIRELGERALPSSMAERATLETIALSFSRNPQVKVFLLVEEPGRRRAFLDERANFVTLDDLRAIVAREAIRRQDALDEITSLRVDAGGYFVK